MFQQSSFLSSVRMSLLACFLLSLFIVTIGRAATAKDNFFLESEFEKAFQKMLEDPSDIEITFEYANLAIELGDYEAAIPPLERILFFNPDLHEIKLKLGVMYYNLKSFKVAKQYIMEAKKSTVDQSVINDADEYLGRMGGQI